MFSKIKIILSISIFGLLLCTNTAFADNYLSNLFSGWYNTNITSRIEAPIQQGCSSTCWLLSAVTSLNQTETGKAIIAATVKSDGNGGAIVTFKGSPNNQILVSSAELAKFDRLNSTNSFTFSTGDADMRALEIAAQKIYKSGDFASRLSDDVFMGREGADKGFTFELLTGSNQTSWEIGFNWFEFATVYFFLPDEVSRLSNSDINNFNNTDQYNTVSFFKDSIYATDVKTGKQQKIVFGNMHEYTITGSDNNFVYLFNPWGNDLQMGRDDFFKAKPTVWTQKLDPNTTQPTDDILSYLNEMGIPSDYKLTDEDYQEIIDGYDFFNFDTENDTTDVSDNTDTKSSGSTTKSTCGDWSSEKIVATGDGAELYCKSLGDGYRLPTVEDFAKKIPGDVCLNMKSFGGPDMDLIYEDTSCMTPGVYYYTGDDNIIYIGTLPPAAEDDYGHVCDSGRKLLVAMMGGICPAGGEYFGSLQKMIFDRIVSEIKYEPKVRCIH
jgi:hypothetical protein